MRRVLAEPRMTVAASNLQSTLQQHTPPLVLVNTELAAHPGVTFLHFQRTTSHRNFPFFHSHPLWPSRRVSNLHFPLPVAKPKGEHPHFYSHHFGRFHFHTLRPFSKNGLSRTQTSVCAEYVGDR